MRNGRIAERAYDVDERVGILVAGDVDERLGPAARRPGDVGELNGRGDPLAWVVHRGEPVEPLIRNFRDADVHVALAAWSVVNAGHQLKQSGFSA